MAGLKTLGLLLEDPKATKAFVRKGGFEAVKRVLKDHPASSAASLACLQLALGNLGYEEVAAGRGSSGGGGAKGKRTVVHPGAVEVMVAMVSVADDVELQCTTLTTIEMLVEDKTNVAVLLQAGALDWLRGLLFGDAHHEGTPPMHSNMRALAAPLGADARRCAKDIVGKLVVGGLSGDPKAFKLKDVCDDEAMHALAADQVMIPVGYDSCSDQV